MKRLISILLFLALAVILSGCGHHGMHGWMVDSGQQGNGHQREIRVGNPA